MQKGCYSTGGINNVTTLSKSTRLMTPCILGCFILGVMFEVNKTQPLVGPNGLKMKYGMGLTPRGMPKKLLGPKNTCELAETENEV